MANNLGTFDFRKLSVIFGTLSITGFADGDAVIVSEEGDAYNSMGGNDGFVDRVKNNVNFLNVTIRLRQACPINQLLSTIHNTDRASSVTLPLLIKDRSGITLISAKHAWIVKNPELVFSNEVQQREWLIKTGSDYVVNIGGND